MNFRKNITLIVGGVAGLLLLIAAVVLLFSFRSSYADHVSAFSSARNRLAALNSRNPFPSADNVKLASENLEIIKSKYSELHTKIRSAQPEADQIEPARFAPLMEDSIRRLKAKVQQMKSETGRDIKLPSDNDVGFKDYAAGKLPPNDTNVMRRLVLQVKGLEALIGLAIDTRLDSVDALQRDEFEIRGESAPAADESMTRGRGRGRFESAEAAPTAAEVGGFPLPASHDLYEVERFVIEVTGAESAVWDFLNHLAANPVLFSIADVSFTNTRENLGKPADFKEKLKIKTEEKRTAAGAQASSVEAQIDELTADERIIGGREPVKARIVADMVLLKNNDEAVQP